MRVVLGMNLPYFGRPGGALKCNRRLMEALGRAGHEATIVVPWFGSGVPGRSRARVLDALRGDGIAVHEGRGVDVVAIGGVQVHVVADPGDLRGYLARHVRDHAPDRVLVSTEDPGHSLLEAALEVAPERVVYLVHTPTFLPFGPQAFFPSARRARLVASVRRVITVSHATAAYIHEHAGVTAEVGAFPVWDPPPYPRLGQFDRGYVTMINPSAVKGGPIFHGLARALPDIAFAAVPTWGTTDRDLDALRAHRNVTLLDPVDDIDQLFARTRVLLVPSLWHEAFGLVVVEAMLRGVPVLASDVGGLPEAKLGTRFVLPVRPIERFSDVLDEHLFPIPELPAQDLAPWRDALRRLLADRELYADEAEASARAAEAFVRGVGIDAWEARLAAAPPPARVSAYELVERDPLRARLGAWAPGRLARLVADARAWLARADADAAYWRDVLALPEPSALPADRPGARGARHETHRAPLPPRLSRAADELGDDALLGALAVLVARHRDDDDVIVGVAGDAPAIVPARVRFAAAASFRDVLAELAAARAAVRAHPPRSDELAAHAFPVVFDARGGGAGPGDEVRLGIEADALAWHYDAARFDGATIARVARRFERLLASLVAEPDAPVARAAMLPDDERRILAAWNATDAAGDARTIVEVIEAGVDRHPARIAVRAGDRELTYAQLDAAANRVAHHLRARGVVAGAEVAVCMQRSNELLVALLGVLKAGAAYVPLDPGDPRERLAFMLGDAGVGLALVDDAGRAALAGAPPALISIPLADDARAPSTRLGLAIDPEQPAYAIYTSGSTGKPKRATNRHAGLANRLWWMQEAYRLDADDRVVQKTPITFDVSVWELFWPLIAGATLVMAAPGGHRDPRYLVELFERERITAAHFVPSMLELFLEEPDVERCTALRRVIASGEALPRAVADALLARLATELHNLYGPTEAAIDVSQHACVRGDARPSVPIGRPIANVQLYVLDAHGAQAPIGVAGELHIAGAGLALGYGGRADLTAARFLPDPYGPPGARMYRTGDLARWASDGELEYLGRIDHQVKVRGHRIELGEIEAALAPHPAVQRAVVIVHEAPPPIGRRLVAYVVPSAGHAVDAPALRAFAAARLPEWMLPAVFVAIDELPLTPSGKLDRKRLPAPEAAAPAPEGRAPADDVEAQVASIWEALFGRRIGLDEDFFDAGGNSLMAVRLLSRLEVSYGVRLPLAVVFEAATIAKLAAALRDARHAPVVARATSVTRVLILSTEYPPIATGGLGTHVRELALGLCATGAEVDVVLSPIYVRELPAATPDVAPVRLHVVAQRTRSHNQDVVDAVERVLAAHGRPDVLHCHDPYLFAAAAELRARHAIPVVGTLHMPAKAMRQWIDATTWREEFDELEADLCRGADQLICVSRSVEEALRRTHGDDIAPTHVVHNAFDPSAFLDAAAATSRDELRRELAPDGEQLVLYVGRLYEAKGIAELIAAIAALRARGRRVRLVVAGAPLPAYEPELARLLAAHAAHRDAFLLLGMVDRARVAALYRAADVAVVPSQYEPFGYTALEAMAAGAPLVATRAGGLAEIVIDQECGVLVPVGERADHRLEVDVDALARALDELLADRAKAARLAAAGRRRATRFTVEAMVAQTLAVYRGAPASAPALIAAPRDARPALSFAQQRLWFLQQLEPASAGYNMPIAWRLSGELDVEALRRALEALVHRHETLRTTFPAPDGVPYQEVAPPSPWPLPVEDATQLDGGALEALKHGEARRVFDLVRGPLLRTRLLRCAGHHLLLVTVHHIVFDGWSTGVFARELGELYAAHVRGAAPSLPPLSVQYVDYAAWQRRWLQGDELARQLAYWTAQLRGAPEDTALPFKGARPAEPQRRGDWLQLDLERELADGLRAVARREKATLFMTLLAVFRALLARYTGQDDLTIGMPIANRAHSALDHQLGLYVNTLVLRGQVPAGATFTELVARERAIALAAYRHQDTPFEMVVDAAGVTRALDRTPLFQVLYTHAEVAERRASYAGLDLEWLPAGTGTVPFDLVINSWEDGDRIRISLDYDVELFDRAVIEQLARHAVRFVREVTADPARPASRVALLDAEERARAVDAGNATARDDAGIPLVVGMIEAQVDRAPDAIAVVGDGEALSYRELDARANRLAHRLVAAGAGRTRPVGVCLVRSPDMIVALLAVLKAGAAFVPIDPAYPPARVHAIVEDGGCALVVDRAWLDAERDAIAACAGARPDIAIDERDAAYVIFTSGSTGRPKGVIVEHAALRCQLRSTRAYGFTAADRCLVHAPFTFDMAVFQALCPLIGGARLVIARPDGERDPYYLAQLIRDEHVTQAVFVPTMLSALVEVARATPCPSLRTLIAGGEALPPATVRDVAAVLGAELFNLYGPTEATMHVSWHRCAADPVDDVVPIGVPTANTRLYILDAQAQPVPIGVTGELYIAGAQLARGYARRPDLTAERFVPDPFHAGERMYRTGDLARFLPGGTIVYLGRVDHQVKLRGLRIELGEIEAVLRRGAGVVDAAVIVHDGAQLVAYVAPRDLPLDALRAELRAALPAYMVPSALVALDALPLTANGKLDRKALPAPDMTSAVGYVAPRTEMEAVLASLWGELLGRAQVGAHDNFFELGGHSLLAVRMIARLRRDGLALEVRTLFATPTLEAVAAALTRARARDVPPNLIAPDATAITPAQLPLIALAQADIDAIVARVPGGIANVQDIYALSPLQEGMLFHHQLAAEGDTYVLITRTRFPDRAILDRYVAAMQRVVERHDVLRTAIVWEGLPAPAQVVWRHAPLPVAEVTFAEAAALDPRRDRFDLTRAPLLRLAIAPDPDGVRWHLVQLSHHIISDHESLDLMAAEIDALLAGHDDALPASPPYRNLVASVRAGGGDEAAHARYFRAQLADVDEPSAPFGVVDALGDGRGVTEAFRALPATLDQRLRAQAQRLGVGLATLCHVAWAVVVARTSGHDRAVFGTVLFGRMHADGAERALGLYLNTLPIKLDAGARSVEASVREAQAALAELMRHEHASLALAQRCSGVAAPAPLFTTLLNYRHMAPRAPAGAALGIETYGGEERTNYPLVVSVNDESTGASLSIQAAQPLSPARVGAMMERALDQLAHALEHAPDRPLRAIDVVAPAEHAQLRAWNTTAQNLDDQPFVVERIEAQVDRAPDAIALVFADEALTYRDLDARANQLAHQLLAAGAGRDRPIGIRLERSPAMVVAVLAVLKAGAAYVPIDPAYPPARVRAILDDSGATLVIDDAWLTAHPGGATARPAIALDGHDAAYVLFTSGSTGRPKGAVIEHAGLRNRLLWPHAFGFSAADRFVLKTPFTFDVSVFELLYPFVVGGCLVIARPDGHRDPHYLAALIRAQGVTYAHFVPSMLGPFLDAARAAPCPTLRRVVCSGEALPAALVRDAAEVLDVELYNLYGPTEATVDVTWWRCEPARRVVPIGLPAPNTRLYVLDRQLRPAPIGVPGELYLAGVQLARGYARRPDLTAERFVPDPLQPGERMYRTGDLARFLDDGAVEYLGRLDHQVKLRGLRIELGEIEAVLRTHANVADAAVVVHAATLVAYVVPRGAAPAIDELQATLRAALPDYMVPAVFVPLAALPLTPSGKLDRKALPAPEPTATDAYVAPRTEAEAALARVWAELLGVERVGVHDNFFALGGHSLLAIRLIARIRQALAVELPIRAVFEAPTLGALAAAIAGDAGPRATPPPLVAGPRATHPPLSFAQARLWFLHQLEPDSRAYHLVDARRIEELDVDALRRAFEALAARHEILRTSFPAVDGEPYQHVHPPAPWALPVVDARGLDDDARDQRIAARRDALVGPFDLAAAPPVRAELVRVGDAAYVVLVAMHHIVTDGASFPVLWSELWASYDAVLAGHEPALPPLPVQYADFAAWQRAWLAGDELARQLAFWTDALRGAPDDTELPLKGPRPPAQTFAGRDVEIALPAPLAAQLRALARAHGATLFMTFAAALRALLARYTGQRDLVVGAPIDNRSHTELAGLIGMFANTLALRGEVRDDDSFASLLAREQAAALAAYDHQHTPFELIVDALGLARSLSRTPLFQVIYQHHEAAASSTRGEPVTTTHDLAVQFDLSVTTWDAGATLGVHVAYNVDLFEPALIEQLVEHFQRLLGLVTAAPDAPLASLDLLSTAEHARLTAWNATARALDDQPFVVEMIEAQVDRAPDAIALVFEGASLTYRELDARANQLAHQLIAAGATRDRPIGVCLERSPAMVVAILAILKAGAPYLPLDPTYPPARVRAILDDSGCVLVVDDAWLAAHPGGASTRPGVVLDGGAAAYVLFTSGSTGRPKGVVIDHAALRNQVSWPRALGFDASDRFVLKTPFTFDVSVFELINPFTFGARLVIARPDGHLDPPYLAELIRAEQATYVHFVPSMLGAFLDVARTAPCPSLRRVVCSGEALLGPLARDALEVLDIELYNLYGPTEATVHVSMHRCDGDPVRAAVPIGAPVANTRFYVLDAHTRPVPVGVAGELYLAGVQLARGYASRPDLTAERFVPDPFHPGERMYRTGDLARRLPDGQIEYLGRLDDQVKLHGQRIELAEIAAVLRTDPAVADAAVVVRDERLVAYIVSRGDEEPDADVLTATLRAALPAYMVPAVFVPLAALPLTASGKLDRKALPAPELRMAAAYVAPRDELEATLARIWGDTLQVERVGVHDDFFALGGHSLLAIRLVAAIERHIGVKIPLRDFFAASTLGELAARLGQARAGDRAIERPALYASATRRTRLPAALRGVFKLNKLMASDLFARHVWSAWIDGPVEVRALERALAAMRARHALLRTRFFDDDKLEMLEVLEPADVERFALLEHADLTSLSGDDQARADAAFHERVSFRPLDVGRGEVMSVALTTFSATRHRLTVSLHNIVSDGETMTVYLHELCALWRDPAAALPPVPLQYHHLADYLERIRGSAAGRAQRAFWQARLDGLQPLQLPIDAPRDDVDARREANAGVVTFRSGAITRVIPKQALTAIERIAEGQHASVMSTLVAAMAAYLSQRTSQRDLAFITRLSHRYLPGLERTLGFLVNPIVLRISTEGAPTFSELVERTHTVVTDAFDHGECDVFELAPYHAFRLCLVYTRAPAAEGALALPEGSIATDAPHPGAVERSQIGYDLLLWLTHLSDGIALTLAYNLELFRDATAEAFLDGYVDHVTALLTPAPAARL